MKLEWSRLALEDRDRIFDHIEQDNPFAAIAVDERISAQVGLLLTFPECGRPGPRGRDAGVGGGSHAIHRGLPDCGRDRAHSACVARRPAMA